MLSEEIQITTNTLLLGSLVFAILDSIFIPVLAWRIKPVLFKQLKWFLVSFTGMVWFGIWTWVLHEFWDSVYRYVFPVWAQQWIPIAFGLLMAGVGLLFWTIAQRNQSNPIPVICGLAGVWGILTHTWAIHRGIVTKPPMLMGASPLAALLIAFFEYIFYWCIIIALSAMAGWVWRRIRS